MASVDVIKCCLDSIRQISDDIKDAIVYLDAGSAESFQFLGAFPLFLELGAVSVCSLDKVAGWSTNSEPEKKVVVITSRLLSDAHRYIIRCLSTLPNVRECAIYTSISEVSHSAYPDSPLGPDAFHEYESLLVQDYEEVVKKHETKSHVTGEYDLKESTASEDEGWSQLTSIEADTTGFDGISSTKIPQKDSSIAFSDDASQKLIVSVHHFPLIFCALSPRVFVLPSEGFVAEGFLSSEHENSISSGLPPLSTGKPSDTEDVSLGATLTAQFLYHLASKMDLKLEIFSLGDLSKNIGKLLTDMSSLYDVGRRKRSAGLLLIDRTLDLLTPCCHGDSLVDRMFSSLSRRERTTSLTQMKGSLGHLKNGPVKLERAPLDVQIPLEIIISEDESNSNFQLLENIEAFLHGWNTGDSDAQIVELMKLGRKLNDKSDLLHGSFISTENFRGAPYLEAILDRRTKDGAMLIKKWLQESLRGENISLDVRIRSGFATKSDLQPLAKALAKRQSCLVKNKGMLQIAAAALNALDEVNSAYWDAFNSAEKILHVNAADTIQSLAAQISDLINKTVLDGSRLQNRDNTEKPKGLITLPDALLLTVIGYLLAGENFPTSGSGGPFSWQEEHFMKEAIVDSILENPVVSKLKFLQGLSEELEANLNKTKFDEKKEGLFAQLDNVDFDDDQWDSWGEDDNDAEKDAGRESAYGDMQLKLELRDRVDNLFKFLHKLSSMRRNSPLNELMLALESKRNDDSYPTKGLLYKIITSALEKHEIPGLEYHSSTVGRLFKSGFGRFGLGQAKPSLAEQNVILIFVIGGINAVEDISSSLVDGNDPLTGHIISTTIGGKNGEPKRTISYMAELVVGTGSFGIVFQAKCLETSETVAIKKVLQDKRYKNRELQLMRLMDHPNVISLKHSFFSPTTTDELFLNLVMDYVPETMYKVLMHYSNSKQRMPLIYVKLYTYQLFRGLAYMHIVAGVCHRDIKPQNILVDPLTHQVKICDFGSAKALVKGEANIAYICSRYYRAPELIFGATEYSTSIDIWSAGCVLAELLLGQPLFPGENAVDQLGQIIKVLGSPTREEIRCMNPNYTDFLFPQIKAHPWHKVFHKRMPPEAIDLTCRLLQYSPSLRCTAIEACAHPFFNELRELNTRLPNGRPFPPLFNFKQELSGASPELLSKLIPEHLWRQASLSLPFPHPAAT